MFSIENGLRVKGNRTSRTSRGAALSVQHPRSFSQFMSDSRATMRLRVDPWDPEYGSSVELEPDLGPPAGLDLLVEEPGDWTPIAAGHRDQLPCCAFVDGVRRIDARLFAEEGGVEAPGLAGSWAVGCAWSTQPPRVAEVRVGRE